MPINIHRVKMLRIILVNFLLVLGVVHINCADNNSKIVCYYDSRAFAQEGKLKIDQSPAVDEH